MTTKHKFTIEKTHESGSQLGVNQRAVDFAAFRRELKLELEHGVSAPEAAGAAPLTGQIAWANLKEFPDTGTRWADAKPKRISSRQRKG
jgi:hypothetical protein